MTLRRVAGAFILLLGLAFLLIPNIDKYGFVEGVIRFFLPFLFLALMYYGIVLLFSEKKQ